MAPRPAQRCCPYTDVTVGSHRALASAPGYSVLARLLRQPGAAGARFSPESARPREGSTLMIMMSARDMYGSRKYGREQHLGACRNRDQRAEHRVLAPQRNGVSRGALESLSYVLRFITEVSSLARNIEGSRRRGGRSRWRRKGGRRPSNCVSGPSNCGVVDGRRGGG